MSLKNFSWSLGKALQLLGLLQAALALVVGLQSSDSKRELTMLLSSVVIFLLGYIFVKLSDR